MTSVEKRRSGRKSGGHRKHSDGGRSDTSSGGSYLDETDREVSNLTDRAFRSLCIGDEAVYNDSDLCSSSPCTQRDRQLAFSHSSQDRYRGDSEREELKRAAHESFSLRMQQYGQDWIHGGMYGAEIQRDPQWDVYGERTEGRVSATFQHSCVETSQQQESLREEQLSFLSNGATELSSQQRRSRSRVSSLIRAFNSEGQRDGAGMDGKLREWNDETSWDKSALMSIQRELSEFSTSYQQNFNNSHFPSAGPFSSRDSDFYSSEVAAVAQMNSGSSFMRSSHSKHSMSAQVNCNSNFFIHSEFSPFKVWRDHNRFPFQQGQVSGFMHCSEFPKWYETPMYRELSLEAQPQGPYGFQERGFRHPRNNLAPMVPPNLSRSTSTVLQKASAVEKRCESELTGHYYPHRKRTQSLGANRLQSQRPSTASPTSEISRRVQDTISSVKALQQKIKMMTEQNMATANQQGVLYSNDNLIPYGNNAKAVTPDVFSSNTRTTPFNISQLPTPLVQAETPEVQQYAVSPQPVEHAPVRAESRGATPDVRMSSYKSRATSLLFNLKDNRKRVKSTYSPPKFKGLETMEKNKQPSFQEPRDTVIDIPDFPDPDFLQVEESSRTNAASHQYQYHSPGLTPNSLPAHTGQYPEYTSSDYQTAQMQSGMVHHSGLTGFIPEDYAGNQLANGQNLHEDVFTPYKQGMMDNAETLGGDAYRLNPSYTATETPQLNADNNQPREYLISAANAEQHFNETVGREFAKVDRYQQLKDNKHDYSNVSSQDRWRQINSQDTENLSLKAAVSPWKQEITALMEKDQHAQAYQRAATIKAELNSPRDKYRGENQQSLNKEIEKTELRESFGVGTSSYNMTGVVNVSNQQPQYAPFSNETTENPAYYGQQPEDFKNKYQQYYGHNKENEMKDNYLTPNYNRYTDQEYRNQHTLYSNKDKSMLTQETGQRKQYTPIPKGYEMQSLQPIEAKPQFEHPILSNPESATALIMANQVKDRQFVEVKAEQAMAGHITAQHAQAELAMAQHWAQVEQPKAEMARLILAGQAGSEKVKAEPAKAELTEHERVNQAKAEHIKEEKRQEEQSREKQPDRAREEQAKSEQTRAQQVTEDPRNITEQVGTEHLREEQGEQVKAKQAEAERLKEEHIKTELAKAEQAGQERLEQAKTEQARRERIKAEEIEEQLRAEQVERERMEAEQIRTEKVKAEQAEAERRKEELAKLQQIQEQQAKTEQDKANVNVGKVKANKIQVEDVKQEKAEEDSVQADQVNAEQPTAEISKANERKAEQAKLEQTKLELAKAEQPTTQISKPNEKKAEQAKLEQTKLELAQAEQPTTQISKANERKAEQAKLEQTKLELARAELTKKENMLERSAKPAAKLTMTQQVKSEPDKVEQVKTELAKAKAELAKIKEKMRGEQKVRNTVLKKEDVIKTDVPLKVNKNEECNVQDQEIQTQREDLAVVSRQSTDQAYRDEFERLREKYGFTDTTLPSRNKVEDAGNVPSNDANETPALSLDKVETANTEKSKDKSSPTIIFAAANTENKEEVGSFKSNEVTESQYVYSESSKEFKLSGGNDLSTNVDKTANSDTVTDKVKDDSEEKLKSCDPLKHTDILQQRDSNLAKPLHNERKPKPTEHSVGPGKDQHFTPSKTLSHKERAQTKQEILTSKIKAHAEKEISAMKEKGFAVRDGFMSKNSTKQLASSNNIRQKPPSQEVSKKQESSMSSNITPKQPMEPSGMQMEAVKSVIPPSSATIPVKTAATTSQLADHLQKQVPKEPMKSDDNVPKPPREAKQMESYTNATDEDLVEKQKKENQSGIKSPIQSKEQAPKNKQGKQEANQEEKQKDGLKDNPAINTDQLNKKKEDPTVLVDSESSKPVTTEAKQEAVNEDPAPSLNLVFGQNETPVDDDSLQITGIMVTVRERKPSVNYGESNYEEISELDKCHHNSGLEVSKGKASSKEDSIVKSKDRAVQNSHSTVKENQTTVGMNNHPKHMQETPTLETKQNNVSENVTVKRTDLQESSSINARRQRVTQLQEPLAEKGVPPTVTVPAKNKVLAETQPLLYKQDIIASETKDYTNETPKESSAKSLKKDEVKSREKNPPKRPTAHTNENSMTNTAINYTNDSNRAGAETLVKHDIQPSVKEDMPTVINPSKSRNIDGKSAPLEEENRYDLPPPEPFKDTIPSNHLTENENTRVSPKHQNKEIQIGENNQADDNVHIGSIAIRVVPAVTEKDNMKVTGKNNVTTVPSDVVATNEHTQVASEEKVTLNNGNRTKDLAPASSEEQIKDGCKDKLGVQCVLSGVRKLSDSLKVSNQQNSINATSEDTQAEHGKPEKVNKSRKSVDESKIRPMVEDYFQVQGLAETNNEPHNHTNVKDASDAVSTGREPPGLPNKAAISNESCNVGNNEVFVLDESIRKTAESISMGVQDENMKRKNGETEDNPASKQTDGPTERHSHKNEKTEAGQAIHIRKHLTENQTSSSARERQRNSHPTRENTAKEKPDVKPKPKERVSTIPEISALADYARLKVIVSEDEASPIQEFPPNKKEGFFPIFQTRHSRRPVFTADPQDFSVKEKSLPTKTEVSSKVNKEPKPLVFPITEKEHQRTGMFKLGDKERQEKMLLDAKANEGLSDAGAKHAQHLKERNKSPTTHLKNQGSEEQRVRQTEQSIHQPSNRPLQATTSSSTINRPKSTPVSQHLKPLDNSNLHEKLVGQVYNKEKSTATKTEERRTEKLRQERLASQHEETEAKQQRRAKQLMEERAARIEEEKRAEDIRVKLMIEENRAALAEEERRAVQREEERRAREREAIAIKIKERREKQREAERKAEEERAAQKEKEMRAKQREEERRVKEIEEKRRIKIEEERRAKLREEEEQKREYEERRRVKQREEERAAQEQQQRRAAQEEKQRRAAQEEEKRRAAQEEQQRRAAQEEQQKRAAQEEQQRRATQEEKQRRAAQEEKQKRAAQEEQQKRAAQEEQQKRAAQEEQQRRAAQEEEQRRAAQEEHQRRAAQEEKQRRAAQEKQQMRAAQEEQQRRAAQEEKQRRAAQEEQQRRAAQEEEQRRSAQEEQQRRAAQEKQQMRAAQEEQQMRVAQEEQQMRAAQEEQQMRAAQEEQHMRAAQEEQQKRAAQEEQQRRAALIEEQRVAQQIEEKKKRKQREEEKAAQISEEERIKLIQKQSIEEQRGEQQKREEWMRTQREEEERRAAEKEKTIIKQREEKWAEDERIRLLEDRQAALKEEEKRVAHEQMLARREDEIRAKKREEEEKLAAHREKEKATQLEEQKRAAQKTDALQYYAITSTESERKPRERQLSSPSPSQQRHNPSGLEDSGSHSRPYSRPHAPASPAPSLPRSNTSSPALGIKPSMFRVKDNTFRGSSFTKSVKPRFHKNFGEDFRVGSPMGSERGDEEQEIMRRSAGTPVYPDTGLNRLAAIKESSNFQPAYSSQDYSAPYTHHRPYSRRSIALDEDDSRSIISNMSEDVESFATNTTDLADVRSLYDYDRPESACSFSSDVSRSLGKPPTVPPKSEKALRRAQRLTTRRIKKELSKTAAESTARAEKSLPEVSSIPSSSIEVRSSSRQAVASPHFSSPVSLAHAPTLGSSLPPSHTEHQSSHSSFHASPHATGPISLPVASPHATAPVSLPFASPNATGPASHTAAPKTVAHVPSSPTFHHANHPAPVTQYHVESSYPQSYPLTQRKVLQDLGSGQYFVVDVPVQVKTKTFFDPETGKYVQLNVRESGQSTSRPQPQQAYPQPQLQPQMQVKPQQQPQITPAGKPFVLYQGGYPQDYQPPAINSAPRHRSTVPTTLHQDQQPVRESHIYGYPAPETGQNTEGHRYSPEKTPYMDTVNDKDKTYNTVYNTHGPYESFPECDTNSQLAGRSVCENDNSAHSQCQPRDIITIGELEDFMEVSDW